MGLHNAGFDSCLFLVKKGFHGVVCFVNSLGFFDPADHVIDQNLSSKNSLCREKLCNIPYFFHFQVDKLQESEAVRSEEEAKAEDTPIQLCKNLSKMNKSHQGFMSNHGLTRNAFIAEIYNKEQIFCYK